MKVYAIRDWEKHFEKNRTKELKYMAWVPFPNKHDGDGYTELLDHPNGTAHFGAWCAIVQVASKCEPRGMLLRDGRRPHTSASLARITRMPEPLVLEAMNRLVSIGWIEVNGDWPILSDEEESAPQASGEIPQGAAVIPQGDAGGLYIDHYTEQNGTTEHGTEQNNTEPAAASAAPVREVFDHYRKFHPRAFRKPNSKSKEWRLIRDRLAEGYTVEDLNQAIDGNHVSPWHCGENPGGKQYHALELIVRDGSNVQKFIEANERGPPAVLSEKNLRGVRAGKSYLEKRMNGDE